MFLKSNYRIITAILILYSLELILSYKQLLFKFGPILLPFLCFIAVFATKLFYDRSLKNLYWQLPKIKYLLMACSFVMIGYFIAYIFGFITLTFPNIFQQNIALLFLILLSAFFEEILWRGFLLKELYPKYNYTITSIVIGIFWALFHTLAFFAINITTIYTLISNIAASFVIIFLTLRANSIWPAAVWHGLLNAIPIIFIATLKPEFYIFLTFFYVISAALVLFCIKKNPTVLQS